MCSIVVDKELDVAFRCKRASRRCEHKRTTIIEPTHRVNASRDIALKSHRFIACERSLCVRSSARTRSCSVLGTTNGQRVLLVRDPAHAHAPSSLRIWGCTSSASPLYMNPARLRNPAVVEELIMWRQEEPGGRAAASAFRGGARRFLPHPLAYLSRGQR